MSSYLESDRSPKRRKIRKGTQSCWECKRRKVRCISTENICQNCRRRGTACISQDLPDVFTIATPSLSEDGALPEPDVHSSDITPSSISHSHIELEHALRSTWPAKHEMDQRINLPGESSALFHSEACRLYDSLASRSQPPIRENLRLPPPGSHPVLITRKLLLLGIYLQGVVLPDDQASHKPESWYHTIMLRVTEAAIKVTKNEDLVNSVEGLECLMLEASYQNHAGNLHQAWMAVRRATTVAQALGLHRGSKSAMLKFLEPMKRTLFDAKQTCLQVVRMECYLSLFLDLPRSSLEAPSRTPEELENLQPVERLQYSHVIVSDRILKRSTFPSLSDTRELDSVLEEAATGVNPQWWLMPNFAASNMNVKDTAQGTSRLNDQFAHFHLLIRLHLPYLMRHRSEGMYDYSKMTAVNASRETLSRYVAFRVNNAGQSYCRGTDFLCFIAATVLSLGHIECSRLRQTSNVHNAFGHLVHSRPSDRGLLERTLEVVRGTSQGSDDGIISQIIFVLEQLLRIEATAASGVRYGIQASSSVDEHGGYHSEATDGGGLRLHIPAFGCIDFGVEGCAPTVSQPPGLLDGCTYGGESGELPSVSAMEDEWDMQGIDLALFEGLFGDSSISDVAYRV
ncbi:hypothetical protein E4T49_00607 [Aureobasidium sp. EXF-10728]|nr:hypothetical protein E4T49_00607 [Aureobasidium sp. EXF-10728]